MKINIKKLIILAFVSMSLLWLGHANAFVRPTLSPSMSHLIKPKAIKIFSSFNFDQRPQMKESLPRQSSLDQQFELMRLIATQT